MERKLPYTRGGGWEASLPWGMHSEGVTLHARGEAGKPPFHGKAREGVALCARGRLGSLPSMGGDT